MKVWVAVTAVILAGGGVVTTLLVDHHLWRSDSRAARPSVGRVARPARATADRGGTHARRERTSSRFALKAAPRHLPVHVKFAAGKAPQAGILFDVHTGRILWRHDAGKRLPIASLTKMMTALIIAREHKPSERVLITRSAVHFQGSGVGVLPRGKKVSLKDLFYGLLLVSGNDAAIALAQHDSRTVPAFVRKMNRWRARMGLRCTHYSSPSGIIDARNWSCAHDLAELARADLANPWIRRVARTREVRFPFPIKGNYLDLYNNNPFIFQQVKGITGLKTGYTEAAGSCYVTTQKLGGHELGVVLLNTPNPLDQVPALLHAGAKAEERSTRRERRS